MTNRWIRSPGDQRTMMIHYGNATTAIIDGTALSYQAKDYHAQNAIVERLK